MPNNFIIHRNDNKSTRRSKKGLRAKIKRKGKFYFDPFGSGLTLGEKNPYLQSAIKYSDEIEQFCTINKIHNWRKSNSTIKLNEDFCLFDNPNKVLRTLLEMLYRAKTSQQLTRLRYDGRVSFGALYLIDNLCWEIAKRRQWQVICENITDSEKEKLSKLRSIASSSYNSDKANMINERVRINRSGDPKADQSYKAKSKDITDMVQLAIRESSSNMTYELPFDAYQAINSTIGEHFDNINLHAPDAEIGVLCGFYDKEKREITILIYNFGATIYDTLTMDSLPDKIKNEILEIIKNHSNKKLFDVSKTFTMENAVTLLAIQEGISSRVKYDKTRGHGLIDYIEHCFNLNIDTKIALISGKTLIRIDKQYKVSNKFLFDRERRVIALNSNNDIYEKPSKTHVFNLDIYFPGVLVETTIPLDA